MSGALQAVRASIRFPMMQLTSVDTTRASLAHMSVMTAPDWGGVEEESHQRNRLNRCPERTKAEAREGAALVHAVRRMGVQC